MLVTNYRDGRLILHETHCYNSASPLAEWRNWQTQRTQNPSKFTLRVGSTPTSATTAQFSINASLSATQQTVNGHRTNQNNMTVDGLGNLDGGSNGSLINNISPDFIQEVKIQTSNFSAEYGRSAGVSFGLMTKTGTNNYHGV